MAFFDLFDMTVAYVQYLYFLISISPESFPDFYAEPFRTLTFLTLDVLNSMSEPNRYVNPLEITLPSWIPLDARLRFAIVGVMLPLLVSIIGVLMVYPILAFGWLLVTFAAFFSMVFGIILVADEEVYIPHAIPLNLRALLLTVGAASTVLLITLGIFGLCLWKKERRKREDVFLSNYSSEIEAREKHAPLTEKAVTRSTTNSRALAALAAIENEKGIYLRQRRFSIILPHIILAFAALFVGFILAGIIPVQPIRFLQVSVFGHVPGGILIGAAFLTFTWVSLSLFETGRGLQLKMYDMFSGAVLYTMLFVISLIYSPVLMSCTSMLWCTSLSCKVGERISVPVSMAFTGVQNSFLDPPVVLCEPCNFSTYEQNCPVSVQTDLCGTPVTESRLVYDQTVPCAYVDVYYKITVAIIFISYTVSYPILLVLAADRGTKILENEYPLEKRYCDEFTERELYYEKVRKSANIAASIYNVYKRRYRRARLTFLLQRVLIVTITSLTRQSPVADRSLIGMFLFLAVCLLYFLYTVLLRPYARPVENAYSASTQIMLAAVAVEGLISVSAKKMVIPLYVAITVAVLIFLAPLTALIVGFIGTFRKDRERAERLQRRLLQGFMVVKKEDQPPAALISATQEVGAGGSATGQQHTNAEKRHEREGEAEEKKTERFAPTMRRRKTSGKEQPRQQQQQDCVGKRQESGEGPSGSRNPGPSTHKDAVPSSSAEDHNRRRVGGAPSDPLEESEPFDMGTHANARDETLRSGSLSNSVRQQDAMKEALEIGKIEDDYFNDKRFFTPSGYFYEYKDIPVLPSRVKDDELQEGEEPNPDRNVREERRFSDAVFHSFISTFASFATLRFRSIKERKEELQDQGECEVTGGEPSQRQRRETDPPHARTPVLHSRDVEERGITKWLRRWQEAIMGTVLLRYEDVLERRQKLGLSNNMDERPFWLTPSETQLQACNVPGFVVPWFCAKNNEIRVHEFSTSGDRSLFSQLRRHKNKKYPALVSPRRFGQASTADHHFVPLMFPPIHDMECDSVGVAGTEAIADPPSGSASTSANASLREAVAPANSWNHSVSEGDTPGNREVPPRGNRIMAQMEQKSEKGDFFRRNLKTKEKGKKNQKQKPEQQNEEGKKPPDHEELSLPLWCPPITATQSTVFETERQRCVFAAGKKLEKINRFAYRRIDQQCGEKRRSTIVPLVIPHMHMEGVDAADWDSFLNRLLEEVENPPERDSAGHGPTASTQEVSPMRTPLNMPKLREKTATNDAKGGSGALVVSSNRNGSFSVIDPGLLASPTGAAPAEEHMAKLRRHFVLAQRLWVAFRGQKERLRALQEAVDHRIAMTIKKYLQVFFLGLGFATVLALVLCVCGMLRNVNTDFVDGVHQISKIDYHLLGYGDWDNFTRHCCCISRTNLTATFPYYVLDVENWLCDNGRVKERVRRDAYSSAVVSGYALRDLCGMEFKRGCTLNATGDGNVVLTGCVQNGTSDDPSEEEKKRW